LGAVITFVDVTERKQAEEALRKSEERSRTLLEINNAIITNLAQDALLHSVAETLRRLIPFSTAAFTLYNAERDTFRVVTEGLRRDLEKEQQYPNDRRLLADGINSHCVVPLIVRGRCLGTLHVASETTNQYSEADAEFLQEVANQVALAVENMKAYEEIAALK